MCNSSNCSHDRLDDDLDAIFRPLGAGVDPVAATNFAQAVLSGSTSTVTFEEDCTDCRGTGRFYSYTGRYVGPCFKCDGKGKRRYKTPAAVREANRAKAAEKRAAQDEAARVSCEAWLEANPAEAAWLREAAGRGFEFAASLWAALRKCGHFTPKQEAAVRNAAAKSLARKEQWAAEKAAKEAGAATVDITAIRVGFASAVQHLKRPKLRVADIQFSLAPATGRNAGSIYVVRASDDTYLGKITEENRFITSRECDAATEAEVIRVATDPKAAAEAHGHEYGYCSCCGRELTNPESVARGIGPVCAERWGW